MGRKSCPGAVKSELSYPVELGKGKSRGSFLKGFPDAKGNSQDPGGPAVVKLRFPSSKALSLRQ